MVGIATEVLMENDRHTGAFPRSGVAQHLLLRQPRLTVITFFHKSPATNIAGGLSSAEGA